VARLVEQEFAGAGHDQRDDLDSTVAELSARVGDLCGGSSPRRLSARSAKGSGQIAIGRCCRSSRRGYGIWLRRATAPRHPTNVWVTGLRL